MSHDHLRSGLSPPRRQHFVEAYHTTDGISTRVGVSPMPNTTAVVTEFSQRENKSFDVKLYKYAQLIP